MTRQISNELESILPDIPAGPLKRKLSDLLTEIEDLEIEALADKCFDCNSEELEGEVAELKYERDLLVDAKRQIKSGKLNEALDLIDRILPARYRYAV